MTNIKFSKDSEQIVSLIFDAPGQSMNVLDRAVLTELEQHVKTIREDQSIKGVIVSSAKSDFIAGADLKMIQSIDDGKQARQMADWIKKVFRDLETCGRPVVAALSGTTLGGGLELALACHYRVGLQSNSRAQIGLPEVSLGLLPGGGGTQRLIRLIGVEKSLLLLVEGTKLSWAEAKNHGIIDALVDSPEAMLDAAKTWIRANPNPQQPWDQKGFKWPGASPKSGQIAQTFSIAPSMVNAKSGGHYPAPIHILSCVFEGMNLDFDQACLVESEYFGLCLESDVSKNLIQSMWFDLNEIKKGVRRPKEIAPKKFKTVGVLGAGMMGAGIAYSTAASGMTVFLKDADLEKAERGKDYSRKICNKRVQQGRMSAEAAEELLSRIKPTDQYKDFSECELVIEAVFENRELKAKVTQESESAAKPGLLMASNTSTLPITSLAKASKDAKRFIGLHFFSPVDKMQLVEIIAGEETSPETIAQSFDYVYQLKKIPILVNDSRGFFTSRCFKTYVLEGLALLEDGQDPKIIEAAGKAAGMPVGPLALTDELSLELLASIQEQTIADLKAEGKPAPSDLGFTAIFKMLKISRAGRKAGAGFYDYHQDGSKSIWKDLQQHFPRKAEIPFQDMIDRILFIQSIESARCLEEGVVTSKEDANIGSVFGWGFPAFRGGVIMFMERYGLERFADRAEQLHRSYGARFAVPEIVKRNFKSGKL